MLHKSPAFLNFGLATLASYLDAQPFLNLTVHEYLWGYEDSLVRLASTVLPNWIPFSKLGLMDRVSGLTTYLIVSGRLSPRNSAYISGPISM